MRTEVISCDACLKTIYDADGWAVPGGGFNLSRGDWQNVAGFRTVDCCSIECLTRVIADLADC